MDFQFHGYPVLFYNGWSAYDHVWTTNKTTVPACPTVCDLPPSVLDAASRQAVPVPAG